MARRKKEGMRIVTQIEKLMKDVEKEFDIPYYPHVSVGWGNNSAF